jgi:hypothetical protein
MKNIHVLSTDKPSRLWVNNLRRRLELDEFYSKHQTNIAKNIYITNDELIKDDFRGWFIGQCGFHKKCVDTKIINNELYLLDYLGNTDRLIWCKKIILTTDLDLIADGVQAIDDEFLEWFIKNPSCELIEIQCRYNFYAGQDLTHYKIIIPKEESKQSEIEQASIELVQDGTIEGYYDTFAYYEKKGFVKGVEWQQKRSYSEEEAGELVYNIIGEYAKEYGITIDGAKLNDLFNQLKKQ